MNEAPLPRLAADRAVQPAVVLGDVVGQVLLVAREAGRVAEVERVVGRWADAAEPRAEGMRDARPREKRRDVVDAAAVACDTLEHTAQCTRCAESSQSWARPGKMRAIDAY